MGTVAPGPPTAGARVTLVPEVTAAGEHHRDARTVAGLDHLGIAPRATGLDHRGDARLERRLDAVREREEGVGGHRGTRHRVCPVLTRLFDGEANGVDTAHLTRADADRGKAV